MATDNIKACPHCGGTACLNSNYSYKARTYFVMVKCDICGAQGKIYNSPEEPAAAEWNNAACIDAISAWNMRKGVENEL
jgi:DnaJ-class molecular chaperone